MPFPLRLSFPNRRWFSLNRTDFERLTAENRVPSVLLFEGEEEYLKQSALAALRKKLLPEGLEDLNETVLEAPETDAVIAAAETMPFLADRRIVLLRDYPALTGRSEADDRLIRYLSAVPATTVLLFYCVQKPDGRKKLYQAVKKLEGVVSFDPLKGAELTAFVTEAFRKLGKECDQRTAEYLTFTSGSDANLLLSEIAKIAAFHPDDPSVDPSDVKALATPTAEATVFQMTEAVVAGRETRAFQIMRDMLRNGEDRLYILAMLLRQFRILQHVKIMQYEKKSQEFIRSALGVPSFAAQQYARQAGSWTGRQVKEAVALCLDTELSVKSGKLPAEGSLESVMLKLFEMRK